MKTWTLWGLRIPLRKLCQQQACPLCPELDMAGLGGSFWQPLGGQDQRGWPEARQLSAAPGGQCCNALGWEAQAEMLI